jgi:transglutaminase-like putative cysteine protease
MNREITQELRISVPSAVEILQSRRGDCNEYATLFAAFARSLGIPTKICVGVVHMDGQFAYHAWNEVYVPTENPPWQPVDSIFSQFPADATHIKLSEGDLENHLAVSGLLGRLKIDILEYELKE